MRWEELRARLEDAFWVVPAACVAGAGALALVLIQLDETLQRDGGGFFFAGGPNSARSLLGAISSSMLTLTALVFSITLIVLQLASSQFSPRVLRTFLHDRRIQLTLGIFTATFVYALVVLREVRGDDGLLSSFVPGIAISVAFGLTVFSVAVLVAYIHHITQSIRVVNIIATIATETSKTIAREHDPDADQTAVPDERLAPSRVLPAPRAGVVVVVQDDQLVDLARQGSARLRLVPRVGDFVPCGAPLIEVRGGDGLDDEAAVRAVLLDNERTLHQDVAFGFRQLVDIAEKALSPGINDPTTAVQCLDQIHDLLRRLAGRPYPSGAHLDEDGELRLYVPSACWDDHVALALDEIRHWGAGSLQVQRRLRTLLLDLLEVAPPGRRRALARQLELLDARTDDLPPAERTGAEHTDGRGTSEDRST